MVAVEPGANLAAILAATHACDHLEVTIADFETADLTGGFDLAVAATSLHWLDPVTTTKKIAGLVRPGRLAFWWTEFGDTNRPTPFRDQLDEVYHDLLPVEPSYRDSRANSESAFLVTDGAGSTAISSSPSVVVPEKCDGNENGTSISWGASLRP